MLDTNTQLTLEDLDDLRNNRNGSYSDFKSFLNTDKAVPKQEPYQSEFVSVNVDTNSLVEALQYDHTSFILLFLHEQEGIEEGVPPFHDWLFGLMTSTTYKKTCIAIPRDHAKTTLAKIAAIHHFIYTKARFLVYVSNTSTIAVQAVRDIVNFIRSPASVSIYGTAIFSQQEEAHGNYMFKWRNRQYIIRALGAGQQIRGMNVDNQRPDLAIIDDLEKAEEGETSRFGYAGLKKWLYGSFLKAMDKRKSAVIQIGNLVSNKSILFDHLQSDSGWKSVCLSVITPEGKPLWPARWSIAELRADLMDYIRQGQLYIWLAEMMNMPSTAANQLIDTKQLVATPELTPDSPQSLLRCITVDPAISKNMAHANAAVIVVHVYAGSYWQVGEKAVLYGVGPYELYNKILELALRWRVDVVGIEDTAYQTSLIYICDHENAVRKHKAFTAVPLKSGNKTKTERILTWINMLKRGMYRLTLSDFDIFEQINNYDLTRKHNDDDIIDACAYITQMIGVYLEQIVNLAYTGNKVTTKPLLIQTSYR